MFITRECDYAVRVIRALADEQRLSVGEICEREDITAPFAYKILKKLQKAEIVRGFRGVHGGYALNQSPADLTLFDVYAAIDDDMSIIECLREGYECSRNSDEEKPCKVHCELVKIQQEFWDLLKRKSLLQILTGGEDQA